MPPWVVVLKTWDFGYLVAQYKGKVGGLVYYRVDGVQHVCGASHVKFKGSHDECLRWIALKEIAL